MSGHILVAQGDITKLSADAIAYSSSNQLGGDGELYSSFKENVPGFDEWYGRVRGEQTIPIDLGRTFWMPLSPDRKPHGVVVVVSTGGGAEPDKAGLAVRNSVTTAVERLRDSGRTDRLLIALPTFRLGRGGDRNRQLRSARTQIQAAAETLKDHPAVDVAFIPYTASLYRIFLEARHEFFGPSASEPRHPPELVRALRNGSCVLFVGAGLSSGAGLPGWDNLIGQIRQELNVAPDAGVDHLDLAQWYREQFGKARLAELLRTTFGGDGTPTLAHYLLMALTKRLVITTNYDHLMEQTLVALKRHPKRVVAQEDVVHTGGAGVYVVKLHGDTDEAERIVLSRDDYHSFFEERPALALLLEGLLLNQTFFFVGYSLRDPNFQQVFSRIARMLSDAHRPAFATSFEAQGSTSKYLKQQWRQQQLELIAIPGDNLKEQEEQFLYFLDHLADEVTMQTAPLALAPDVPPPKALLRLRERLEQVGEELESLRQSAVGEKEAIFLAEVLRFLTAHGWRPSRGRLSHLWEELAQKTSNADARQRMLIAALSSAEAFSDVRRVRRQIAAEEEAERRK
jgi:hypothetical protein